MLADRDDVKMIAWYQIIRFSAVAFFMNIVSFYSLKLSICHILLSSHVYSHTMRHSSDIRVVLAKESTSDQKEFCQETEQKRHLYYVHKYLNLYMLVSLLKSLEYEYQG